ncbi:MAG: hypothetical protein L6Q76_00095 [Polyangiaceae bacterium]|nr:hypothetical protein [Polyangiaceae bacterium]
MIVIIPTTGGVELANQTQRTALDGRDYLLTLRWNQREEAWYLDLADADDVLIRAGMKLVMGQPLLRGVLDARRPPGELLVLDMEGTSDAVADLGPRIADPGLDDLGVRHHLAYLDAAELAA